MTTTAQSILDGLQKAMLLRVAAGTRRPKGRYSNTNYSGADLRAIRAQKGVGRPPMTGWAKAPLSISVFEQPPQDSFTHGPAVAEGPHSVAVREFGSQRAAARALGLALSTFQRRLAREAA